MDRRQANATSVAQKTPTARKRYLPLGINVAGLKCLVVGGGRVGARKALTLAQGAANVTVIAPDISVRLRGPIQRGVIRWEQAQYAPCRLDGFSLVVAATPDPALNIRIGQDAEGRGILSCVVSPGRFSRVIFPAVHTAGGVTVAVHSNGRDCAESRTVRDEIARMMSERKRPPVQFALFGARRPDLPAKVFNALARSAARLRDAEIPDVDFLFLSTCRRWECYFLAQSPAAFIRDVRRIVQDRCQVLLEAHRPAFYSKRGVAAFHHLLRVVSGLDSPLRGETDIVGQVRSAAARSLGGGPSALGRMFSSCLRAQKSVRRESGLSAEGKNWATATMLLLERQIAALRSPCILLFGCGRLSEAIASRLLRGPARVLAFSRRADTSGVGWCSEAGLVVGRPEALADHLAAADALILSSDLSPDLRALVCGRLSSDDFVVIDLTGRHDAQLKGAGRYFGLSDVGRVPLSGDGVARVALAERLAVEQALRWHVGQNGFEEPGVRSVVVGARPSRLSRAQVAEVVSLLKLLLPRASFELESMDTPCDRDRITPLPKVEADDFFTRDLDDALLRGEIDLAVHSAKDLPNRIRDGLCVAALTPAFAPWEALVTRDSVSLAELPSGSRVGTSSVRRRQRLAALRPDVVPCDVRGNVPDRLAQLDEGTYDGLVLAGAGLVRLGLQHRISQVFSPAEFPPMPGQGALALVVRTEDTELRRLLQPLDLGDREGLPWA